MYPFKINDKIKSLSVLNRIGLCTMITTLNFASSANAAEYLEEWKILGPGFSRSSNAQLPLNKIDKCFGYIKGMADGDFSNWPKEKTLPGFPDLKSGCQQPTTECPDEYLIAGGPNIAVFCNVRRKQVYQVNGANNPAIGLSYERRFPSYSDKVFGTFLKDSYSTSSLMIGAGRLWTVWSKAGFILDAGVIGGAWYRGAIDPETGILSKRIVPYLMPALSINEESTGLGLNVAFTPKYSVAGKMVVPAPTLMFQTTFSVKKNKSGSASVNFSATADSLSAQVITNF